MPRKPLRRAQARKGPFFGEPCCAKMALFYPLFAHLRSPGKTGPMALWLRKRAETHLVKTRPGSQRSCRQETRRGALAEGKSAAKNKGPAFARNVADLQHFGAKMPKTPILKCSRFATFRSLGLVEIPKCSGFATFRRWVGKFFLPEM